MADIKSRTPYRLSDKDYDEWFTRWVAWFLAFPNTPEFANWLRSGLYALDAAFHDALVAVGLAKIAQDNATELWNESVKNLRDLLVKLRISLPTLTPGDDSVLDKLNLRGEVPPRDADDLVHYAELVDEAWQPLSGDPAYAPFADRLNLIAPSLTDINDKRVVMGQAILAYSTACDVKTAAREECNTRERAVFNFFRGEDKPPEFWTSSHYGLPGGGEEPSVVYPVFPEPPDIFTAEDKGGGMTEVVYGYVDGSTHGLLERRKAGSAEPWIEVSDHLPMDKDNMLPYRELHVPPGEWEYRFTPMNGDEHGASVSATVVVGE